MESRLPIDFVDIHNHLIPGVDDGARKLDESLNAIAAMHGQGVRRIICTPHIDAELISREQPLADRLVKIDAAWDDLVAAAAERFPDVGLKRGHEIMIDTPRFDLDEPRLRMGGSQYVLVEFPRLFVPSGSEDVLYNIRVRGWIPIIAHPERYMGNGSVDLELIGRWRHVGAVTIVNAGSLAGGFGRDARTTAMDLLRRGWVDMIGSDYHARPNRPLLLRQVYDQLVEWGGEEQARLLLSVNPGNVFEGNPLEPVQPLETAGGWWQRVRRIFAR